MPTLLDTHTYQIELTAIYQGDGKDCMGLPTSLHTTDLHDRRFSDPHTLG